MKKYFLLFFFAVSLFSYAPGQEEKYERAKLWQTEIDALAEIDRRQTPPKDAVLFVGSSSIRRWDNLRNDFSGFNVINRGFGGSHLEDVNFYFDRVVVPFQAKKIFLYAGENDINDGKTPERVLADFRKFVALVRKKSLQSKVFFISLKPSPSRWNLREQFQKTNALVKAECEKSKNTKFIDVWAAMLNEKGEPKTEIFIEDKLHMNQKGYDIWRAVLVKYLKWTQKK